MSQLPASSLNSSKIVQPSDIDNNLSSRHFLRMSRPGLSLKIISRLSLVVGTAVMMLFAITESSLSTLLAYLFFGLIGLSLVWRYGSIAIRIYTVVYLTTVLFAVLLYLNLYAIYGVPYYQGGSDDLTYEIQGRVFADRYSLYEIFNYGSIRGNVVSARHNSVGYVYIVGVLTEFGDILGGFHTMIPRIFNALLLSLLSVLVFRYMLLITDKTVAIGSALFSGLMPGMIYISGHTFRDITIALFIFLAFYTWSAGSYFSKSLTAKILITLVVAIVLVEFRTQTATLVSFAVLFSYAFALSKKSTVFVINLLVSFAIILFLLSQQQEFISDIVSLDVIENYLEVYGDIRGGRENITSFVFETPFPLGIFLRLAYGLFAPLPSFSVSLVSSLFAFGVLIQLYFFSFLVLGIFQSVQNRNYWPILVFAGIGFLPFALITGAIRNVPYYWPFFVILAGIGYHRYPNYRKTNRIIFTLFLSLAFLAFVTVLLLR